LWQVNPLDESEWRQEFCQTQWYHHIRQHLPRDVVEIWSRSGFLPNTPISRDLYRRCYFGFAIFYFYQYLTKINPDHILDIGCGSNVFKDLVPGLVGLDPYHPDADICDLCDDEYVAGHERYFSALSAVNSLHFVGLDQMTDTILKLYSMLRAHGRAFITLGLGQMINHTSDPAWQAMFTRPFQECSASDIISWVDQQLRALPIKFLVVDHCYLVQENLGQVLLGNPVDGNIRLVMEKTP
jgi:hypothetical protein